VWGFKPAFANGDAPGDGYTLDPTMPDPPSGGGVSIKGPVPEEIAEITGAGKVEAEQNIADGVTGGLKISSNTMRHINNTHNPIIYAQQLKFKPQDAIVRELQHKSFFNSNWNTFQIENAVNAGYAQAVEKHISTGTYTFRYADETITVVLKNGEIQTAYGNHIYTHQQILKLLK
jgi:hypothetical protein